MSWIEIYFMAKFFVGVITLGLFLAVLLIVMIINSRG